MTKILIVDHELCTGCRLCEVACSVKKEGVSNPSRSRIHVIKWEMEGYYQPMFCQQCDNPLCEAVCPVNAIQKDDTLGRMTVNDDRCIVCRACVSVCPFGGVGFDSDKKKIIRCDLCDGDPTCLKFCQTQAIQYIESDQVQIKKQRGAAEKIYQSVKKTEKIEDDPQENK